MRTRGWPLALALFLITAPLSACKDDAAGPDTFSGRAGFRVGMDLVIRALPGGESEVVAGVVDLDTINNPTDLFGRATGTPDVTWPSPRFADTYDLGTDFGRKSLFAPRHWVSGFVPDDPRKPFLMENTNFSQGSYAASEDHIRFWSPTALGADCPTEPCWAYSSDIDDMGPDDSWFAVGLVRYGVQVNGLVDQLEILVNDGVVEEPDSLVPLGGALAGYANIQSDHWMYNGEDCLPVLANANPFILGHFKTGPTVDPKDRGADFTGESDADYCYYSNGVWSDNGITSGAQPFAPNALQSFDLPSYNYLVMWTYDRATGTVKFDEPWLRAQIGVDLDLNGDPIPHSFAPFPTAPGREASEYASFTDFLADPRVAAGASRIDVIVTNLKPLASGTSYQLWLFDEVEGDAARIDARYVLQRPDTLGENELGEPIIQWTNVGDTAVVQGFDGAVGLRHAISIRNRDLTASGIRLSQFTHVVVTLGASDASPANSPAPAWYRYTNQNDTRANLFDNEILPSGAVRFGFLPELANKGVGWSAFGGASVQYVNVEGFSVSLSRLARPPLGYYYNVWLTNPATGAALNVGPITTPPPGLQSLRDADVQRDEQYVTNGEILQAVKWATWSELGANFKDYTNLFVTLEPKDGAPNMRAPSVIFAAAVPGDLDKLPPDRESK